MPLPPYIHEKLDDDRERYQTVYAKARAAQRLSNYCRPAFYQGITGRNPGKGVHLVYLTLQRWTWDL